MNDQLSKKSVDCSSIIVSTEFTYPFYSTYQNICKESARNLFLMCKFMILT